MANEFKIKHGFISLGNGQIEGTLNVSTGININGDVVATRNWVNSSALAGYATQSYVNTAVSNLVDSAPGTLDTLNELAAALGDDPNFATTVTNSIATKLPLAGGTMTGTLRLPWKWNSTDITDNSFYVQRSATEDGFAFGIGTGVSTWFSWDGGVGTKRAIDVWNDGSKILLGDGGHDTEISNNLYVSNHIFHTGDTDTYMQFHAADQWRVVTGGVERLEVNSTQVSISNNLVVTGTVSGSNLNVSNWNTAYGWGNHASAGYGLSTADITAVGLTTSTLTLTRAAGNLTVSVPTFNQNTTGNAASATILQTTRSINGTNFNGSANITTANWGTARTLTIGNTGKSVNGAGNVSWSLDEIQAEYRHPNGVPRNNLGSPTVREMALFNEQFNNKTAFLDPSRVTVWKQQTNGAAWEDITANYSQDNIRRFIAGYDSSANIFIPNGVYSFRIEVTHPNYVFANAVYFYWSSQSHSTKLHLWARRTDNQNWYQRTSSTTNVSSWPGHLYMPFSTIPWLPSGNSSSHYDTLRFEFIPTWQTSNPTYANTNIDLYKMQVWGGYPAGTRFPYTVNEYGDFTLRRNLSAPGIVYANGGNSSNWNTAYGWGNHASVGYITSSGSISGNAATATKLQTTRNIALGGDVSGSANFDGSANITITTTVADDSHNHIISNVDGLQAALDGKQAAGSYLTTSGKAADSDLLDGLDLHTGRNNQPNKVVRTQANGYVDFGWINTTSGDRGTTAPTRIYASNDEYIRYYTPTNFRAVLDLPTRTGGNASGTWSINVTGSSASTTGNAATATTLQTARTLTIGNTGKTFNGGANVSWSLSEIGAQAALTNPVTGTGSSGQVSFFNGTTTQTGDNGLFWDNSNKRLGIGTTAPQSELQIGQSLSSTVSVNKLVSLNIGGRYSTAAGNQYNVMGFSSTTIDSSDIYLQTAGELLKNFYIGTFSSSAFFNNNRFSIFQGGVERLTVQGYGATVGNVGIGNTTPASKLEVTGNVAIGYTNAAPANGMIVAGNVGIGTTAPEHKLHLGPNTGNVKLALEWSDSHSATSGEAYSTIYTSGQGGIYPFSSRGNLILQPRNTDSNGAGDLVVMTGATATPKFVVQTGGNVGIGTTSPTHRLTVAGGNVLMFPADNTRQLSFFNDSYGITASSGLELITGDYIRFRQGSTELAKLTTTGLGIGTTNPTFKLDVSGTARFTSTVTAPTFSGALSGNATTATTLQTARTLTIGSTGKTFNGSANVAWSLAEIGAYAATNPSQFLSQPGVRASLSFTAGSGAYNNTTGVITIPTNTNQLTNGAGFTTYTANQAVDTTSTPTFAGGTLNGVLKLKWAWNPSTLSGNSLYAQNGTTDAWAIGQGTGVWTLFVVDNGTQRRAIDVSNDNSMTQISSTNLDVANTIRHIGDTNTYLQFHAADQWRVVTGGTERLEVNNTNTIIQNTLIANGNVGIGTTGPGYPLEVSGNTGGISIYTSDDIVAFSDISVKGNIRPIEGVLERVSKSRGVVYDRIDTGTKDNIGFIAQELEEQFPELVVTNPNGTKAVKYQNATAVLFEAVKELKQKIESQEERLNKLEQLIAGK